MKECDICGKEIPLNEEGYCVSEDETELCMKCADDPKEHQIEDAIKLLKQVVRSAKEHGGVYEKAPLINSIEYFIKTGHVL